MSLRVERLCVTRRGRALLDEVEVEVAPGELLALVGPNGAGKTTLLRAIVGLLKPQSGRVLLGQADVRSLSARARASQVAWLPQHVSPAEELTALDIVVAARFRFDEPFRLAAAEARKALARVALEAVAERSILTLSGGERQRVALAALLAQAAPLVLLDEPANHLDPAQQIEVYRLLGELWREGLSVVCVTHDINLLRHLAAPERVRVAGISNGQLRFQTSFADDSLPEKLGQLFGVRMNELRDATQGSRVLVAESLP